MWLQCFAFLEQRKGKTALPRLVVSQLKSAVTYREWVCVLCQLNCALAQRTLRGMHHCNCTPKKSVKPQKKGWIPLIIFTFVNFYKPCLWLWASHEAVSCLKQHVNLASCKEDRKDYARISFHAGTMEQMGKITF